MQFYIKDDFGQCYAPDDTFVMIKWYKTNTVSSKHFNKNLKDIRMLLCQIYNDYLIYNPNGIPKIEIKIWK